MLSVLLLNYYVSRIPPLSQSLTLEWALSLSLLGTCSTTLFSPVFYFCSLESILNWATRHHWSKYFRSLHFRSKMLVVPPVSQSMRQFQCIIFSTLQAWIAPTSVLPGFHSGAVENLGTHFKSSLKCHLPLRHTWATNHLPIHQIFLSLCSSSELLNSDRDIYLLKHSIVVTLIIAMAYF